MARVKLTNTDRSNSDNTLRAFRHLFTSSGVLTFAICLSFLLMSSTIKVELVRESIQLENLLYLSGTSRIKYKNSAFREKTVTTRTAVHLPRNDRDRIRLKTLIERLVRENVKTSIFSKIVSGWRQSSESTTKRRKLMAKEIRGMQYPNSCGKQLP